MSRKARHLQILEESKKEEYNLDKPSKALASISKIQDARYDEARAQANAYAASLGLKAPNLYSYERGGRKRKNKTKRRKLRKTRGRK
jgi:hypothetical protein